VRHLLETIGGTAADVGGGDEDAGEAEEEVAGVVVTEIATAEVIRGVALHQGKTIVGRILLQHLRKMQFNINAELILHTRQAINRGRFRVHWVYHTCH